MNPIKDMHKYGQSIWLDLISRSLLTSGELKSLIDQGVTGVTSNPSIFQKSIGETSDYEAPINSILAKQPGLDAYSLYEILAIEDIQMAADALRPIYDSTDGTDGFVSLEVSPHLSADTAKTVSEAQRLWDTVNRPNLMIKVPATPEGIPAVEALISRGINVNATLIFSVDQYAEVANAYIRGLKANPTPAKVASVASFFVSRLDTAVDKLLDKNGSDEALRLRGKSAVALTKIVYKKFNEIFSGAEFAALKAKGGKIQKMVWGSTGTKNPAYSDVLYVEEIIGKDSINTIPMATLKAYLDHGKARNSIVENVAEAEKTLDSLKQFGIDLNAVTDQLLSEGVVAFVKAFDQMLDSLKIKYNLK